MVALFDTGCISPLSLIAINEYSLFEAGVEFFYDSAIKGMDCEFLYFSSGHNESTIKIAKIDFMGTLEELKIKPIDFN